MICDEPLDLSRHELLQRLEPFVVAASWRYPRLNLRPLGKLIPTANRYDPLCSASVRFLERLVRLDRLTFGPEGMPMPEWLFVDGSALPGVISGLGLRAREMPAAALQHLGFSAWPEELIPLAMYIAVPVRWPGVWYGHNLASLNRLLPELELRGLATVTKALGLRVMRCVEQLGATQWSSKALHVHTHFGPLELLTAWTPAHGNPATLTYRLRVNDRAIARALSGERPAPAADERFWIEASDTSAIRALEARIERGEHYAVVGPPQQGPGGAPRVPVARFTPAPAASAGAPARCADGSPPDRAPASAAHRALHP